MYGILKQVFVLCVMCSRMPFITLNIMYCKCLSLMLASYICYAFVFTTEKNRQPFFERGIIVTCMCNIIMVPVDNASCTCIGTQLLLYWVCSIAENM